MELNHIFFSIVTYFLDPDVGPNPAYETRPAEPGTLFFQYFWRLHSLFSRLYGRACISKSLWHRLFFTDKSFISVRWFSNTACQQQSCALGPVEKSPIPEWKQGQLSLPSGIQGCWQWSFSQHWGGRDTDSNSIFCYSVCWQQFARLQPFSGICWRSCGNVKVSNFFSFLKVKTLVLSWKEWNNSSKPNKICEFSWSCLYIKIKIHRSLIGCVRELI